jgi:hypothetical protein
MEGWRVRDSSIDNGLTGGPCGIYGRLEEGAEITDVYRIVDENRDGVLECSIMFDNVR